MWCQKADILFALELCQKNASTDYIVNIVALLLDKIEFAYDLEFRLESI